MLLLCLALSAAVAVPQAARATCPVDRPVVLADLDWDSNRFHTAIVEIILGAGFGCEVRRMQGPTLPLVEALAAGGDGGGADIMMEVWRENVDPLWSSLDRAGQVALFGVAQSGAEQGWYVPRYVIEGEPARAIEASAPALRSVDQLADYRRVFRDPENPSRGRFLNCPLGWGCERINTLKLRAYGLAPHFTNYRPRDERSLIDAVERAFRLRQAVLFYYWSPTWLLGVYDVVKLEEPPYDAQRWQALLSGATNAAAVAWPTVTVRVGANAAFAGEAPSIAAMLSRYWMRTDLVVDALAYRHVHPSVDMRRAALWFLREHPMVWRAWLNEPVADAVGAALDKAVSTD